jgi:hypothetical protein
VRIETRTHARCHPGSGAGAPMGVNSNQHPHLTGAKPAGDPPHGCRLPSLVLNVLMSFLLLFSFICCYRYRLTMDESKSKTNIRCCVECVVVRYIFCVMYGDRGRYGSRHYSFMRPLYQFSICLRVFFFCCPSFMLQVWVNRGWIEIGNHCKMLCRVRCSSLHYLSNVWGK